MTYSNQRITKIKLDTVLDLLEKAESIPVEDAVTIDTPGGELASYPTINLLRFWTRDNILKGISGVMPSYKYKCTYSDQDIRDLSSDSSYDPENIASPGLTTILDGLILDTSMHKWCNVYNTTSTDNIGEEVSTPVYEFVPKPGLQLSNLLQHIDFKAPAYAFSNTTHPYLLEIFPEVTYHGVLSTGVTAYVANIFTIGERPQRQTIVSHQTWAENQIAVSYWRGLQVDSNFFCMMPRDYELLEESSTVASKLPIYYIQAGPRLNGTYYDKVSFEAMTNTQRWNWFKSHQKGLSNANQNLFYSFPVIPSNYTSKWSTRFGTMDVPASNLSFYSSYPGDDIYLSKINSNGYIAGKIYGGQQSYAMAYWYIC